MFKHQDLKMLGIKLNKYEYFHPLQVGRSSETQLQVGTKMKKVAVTLSCKMSRKLL